MVPWRLRTKDGNYGVRRDRLERQYRGFPFRHGEFEVLGGCSSDSIGWKKFC